MSEHIHIPSLTATFNLPLKPYQIPQWRGAVAESAGWNETLFHNHQKTEIVMEDDPVVTQKGEAALLKQHITLKDTYIYRYPQIQYRVINGKAGIYAIGEEACQRLKYWLFHKTEGFYMLGRKQELLLHGLYEEKHEIHMSEQMKTYNIRHYLGLNQENFLRWEESLAMKQRVQILEEVLVGQILGFCESMGYRLPQRLEVALQMLHRVGSVNLHGARRLRFDLDFRANIELPDGLALGKGVSHGFGVLGQLKR